mmetsp:Transcript_24236/g.33236  ORF Transcript_24236/g.33236 Transcript_24236/m.33236 type:complete len:297 (+) Transcript_24236:949-1839(+)
MDPLYRDIYSADTNSITRPIQKDSVSEISIGDHEQIQQELAHFSEGYNDSSIKILTDSIPKAIDDIKVLPDVIPTAKIEDVGNKLYLNFLDLLKAVDNTLFEKLIFSNFNIAASIISCRTQRIAIETEILDARAISEEIAIEPKKQTFDLKYDRAIRLSTVEIRTKVSDPAQVAQDIENAQNELLMKFNMLYLDAIESYEQKILLKNKAQNTLRDAQQNKNRAQILEMVLKAFEAASRKIVAKIKDAVQTRYPSLSTILKGSVTLPATTIGIPETVHNPWDESTTSSSFWSISLCW